MAANAQAMTAQFKQDLFNGYHAMSAAYRAADTFKAALYIVNQSLGVATTAYGSNTFSGTASTSGSSTTLTFTATTLGNLYAGMLLVGSGITAGTYIASIGTYNGTSGTVILSAAMTVASTTVTSTGEVGNGTGTGYTAAGTTFTWVAPANNGTSSYATPSASFSWTTFTSSGAFDTVLLYNSTQSSKAISVHTFGSQTVSAGTFTLTMPTNAVGTALIQLT